MASSRFDPVYFEAVASDAATEVFLVDDSLNRIASGVGRVEKQIEPGLYKVRFRSGASQHDELVEVTPSPNSQRLLGKPVPFASAAPIDDSLTTTSEHAVAAAELSRKVRPVGRQGELFLFLRGEDPNLSFNADSVSIHALNGELIANLSQANVNNSARYAGITLALDCGSYRIRVSTASLGDYELFATVCKGWQTQVFLVLEVFEKADNELCAASLRRASVFMVRSGQGFNPACENFRLTELAQQALGQGRSNVSRGIVDRILSGKFDDPIMGIAAAHLLLQGHRNDRHGLFEMVLNNLDRLLGAHPDLLALKLAHNPSNKSLRHLTVTAPPLLSASWKLLSRATRRRAGLIEPDCVPGLIAHNVASGGPWLIYRLHESDSAPIEHLSLAEAEQHFRELLATYGDRLDEIYERRSIDRLRFSGLEQSLLALMQSEVHRREISELPNRQKRKIDPGHLLRRIEAPAYSVASAVAGLDHKLKQHPGMQVSEAARAILKEPGSLDLEGMDKENLMGLRRILMKELAEVSQHKELLIDSINKIDAKLRALDIDYSSAC